MPLKKEVLLIIGPYPPPYGGVSVHIKRLADILQNFFQIIIVDESKKVKEGIFNVRSLKLWYYLRLLSKADIIHIHGCFSHRLFHFIVSFIFRKKIVITFHSYVDSKKGGRVILLFNKLLIKYSYKTIFVSEEINSHFQLKKSYSKKVYTKEAFIPADLSKEEQLPKEVSDWLTQKKASSCLICCANAARLNMHNNEDLYGLDLCIEAARILKKENLKIAFIFVIGDSDGAIDVAQYKALISKYEVGDYIYIYELQVSFVKLISESDIVIRPTNTDGDALTIREGIFSMKPVIASDIIVRPQGTILFTNRNVNSLVSKIKGAAESLNAGSFWNQPTGKLSDYVHFYKDTLYL